MKGKKEKETRGINPFQYCPRRVENFQSVRPKLNGYMSMLNY